MGKKFRKPYKVSRTREDMAAYLLIVGCSQKKDQSPYPMKALDRYEGVNFKVIKKFRRERTLPANLDILIISAQYGLLKLDSYIEDYDVRMTEKRASNLRNDIMNEMKKILSTREYKEIFVNLGKDYLPAITGIENIAVCPVVYAQGRIGEKMRSMKKWITRVYCSSETQKTLTELCSSE